jgi:outer membrane protein TolC
MRTKIIYILFLATIFSTNLSAQENELLQIYRKMALSYNQDMKAAKINTLSAQENVKSAKSDFLPKVSASVAYSYTANPLELNIALPGTTSSLGVKGDNEAYKGAIYLAQPIFQGGKVKNAYKLAYIQSDIANIKTEKVLLDVIYQTDIRYWTAVAEKELIGIINSYLNSTENLVKIVKERVDAEQVSRNDLLMVEVKLNDVKYIQKQAETNLYNSLLALNSHLGQDLHTKLIVEDSVPSSMNQELSLPNVYSRPELEIAQKKIEAQQSLTKINDARFRPSLSIGAEGNYSSPGYDFNNDLDPNYALQLKLKIPIFEWNKRKHEKKSNQFKEDIAKTQYQKVRDNISLEIEAAYSSYLQSIEQVNLNKNSLEKAEENEMISLERYENGYSSITEVIDAQLFLQTARKNFVAAKIAAQLYHSAYVRALGKKSIKYF